MAEDNCLELQNIKGGCPQPPTNAAPRGRPRYCSACAKVKPINVLLCAVILVEWTVLTLPILFYHLPNANEELFDHNVTVVNDSNTDVCNGFPYPDSTSGPGGVCQTELTDTLLSLNCDTGETPLVLRDAESSATPPSRILPLLQFLNPSPACSEAVVPFLCVFLFGLCDSSGVSIQPTSTQCEHIRDVLCPDEWVQAAQFVELPDCSSFPVGQVSCVASHSNGSGSGSGINELDLKEETTTNLSVVEPFKCMDGFYRDNASSVCLPSCHSWIQFSKEASITVDVIVLTTATVGIVTALITMVISVLNRDQRTQKRPMFTFPSVIIFYETVGVFIIAIFVLVNYMDRPSLFCTSKNIFESIFNVTPFCVISGMVFVYVLMQLTIFWILHIGILFWNVCFPFKARQTFDMPVEVRKIHAACLAAGLLIPLVPVGTSMIEFGVNLPSSNVTFLTGGLGFGQIRFPAILCTPTNSDVVFYSFVLPVDIIFAIGCTLLTIVFFEIYKSKRRTSQERRFQFTTVEKKLLVVLSYIVILTAVALTTYTVSTRNLPQLVAAVREYFICEQGGHDPDNACSRSKFQGLNDFFLTTLSYVLVGLLPVVNLVYAQNGFTCCKKDKYNVNRHSQRIRTQKA